MAPHITGTDNRKVNFVIASFDIPCNLPARIVVPLLEKPGITANFQILFLSYNAY